MSNYQIVKKKKKNLDPNFQFIDSNVNIDKTRVGGSQKKGLVGGKYRPKEVDKKGKKKVKVSDGNEVSSTFRQERV